MYYFPILKNDTLEVNKLSLKKMANFTFPKEASFLEPCLILNPSESTRQKKIPLYGEAFLSLEIIEQIQRNPWSFYYLHGKDKDYCLPTPKFTSYPGFVFLSEILLYYHLLYQMADEKRIDEYLDLERLLNAEGSFQETLKLLKEKDIKIKQRKELLPPFVEVTSYLELPLLKVKSSKGNRVFSLNERWNNYIPLAKQNSDFLEKVKKYTIQDRK